MLFWILFIPLSVKTCMNQPLVLFTLPCSRLNLPQYNNSGWQIVALTSADSLRLLSCVLIISFYLFICLFYPSLSSTTSLISDFSSSSVSAESLCFSIQSSRVPSALGRQMWWREESSPPMCSSSSAHHCWRLTCSHSESGENKMAPISITIAV